MFLLAICAVFLSAQTGITDRVKDITLPNNNSVSKLYIELKGGDGGNATTGKCRAYGGTGALVKAVFEVGSKDKQIPPGSTLRFIRGEKGESENFKEQAGAGDAGGAGGGGSAVLYRKPGSTSDTDWQILAVAGGGGGAYSGIFAWICTDTDNGKGGNTTTSGGNGKAQTAGTIKGGTDGDYGISMTNILDYGDITSGGGAGAYYSAEKPNAGEAAQKGYPSGGSGGHCPGCQTGGFGFGGGGMALYGPGGGGYSGGGAGSIDYAGGGGSYVSDMRIGMSITAGAAGGGKNEDGSVLYQFDPDPDQIANLLIKTVKLSKALTKCIDLSAGNTSNGANIQLFDCNGTDAQQWIYDVLNQSIRSGIDFNKCLDLKQGNTANQTNIQLFQCNNTDAQKWIIDGSLSAIPTGTDLSIRMSKYPDKCVDIRDARTANGTNIQLYSCYHPANSQYFLFDNRQIKMQAAPDKCLSPDPNTSSGAPNVILLDCIDNNLQEWYYDGFAKAFRSAVNTDMCLDVDHSNTADGTNIQLYPCNGTDAQQFEIY